MKTDKYQKRRDDPIVMGDDALPCPFCGEQPSIPFWHGGGPQKRMIECSECVISPYLSLDNRIIAEDSFIILE